MRHKDKEIFKRYQESLEPLEMCVVAAGNHGFGFGLPSSVMELLGSLFSLAPLMLRAESLSTAEGAVPEIHNHSLFFSFFSPFYKDPELKYPT